MEERILEPKQDAAVIRDDAPRSLMVDDRYRFLVVEESLPTETIAEYRRSRQAGKRRDASRVRARIVARLSRSFAGPRRVR